MLWYGPTTKPPRGLCLIVSDAVIGTLEKASWPAHDDRLAADLQELAIATVATTTSRTDLLVARQLHILTLLQFAEKNLPSLPIVIVVDQTNQPSVVALLRGRPTVAARVRTILPLHRTGDGPRLTGADIEAQV